MSRFLSPAVRFIKGAPNGDLSAWLTSHGDLLVVIAMIAAIAAIIIPIPTFLISLFVIFNLAAALILLIVSLYLPSPTQLSSYPTILLITTLFRLCLSISVSRVILTSGHAGDVIQGLGQVTASGNLIVGAVMFLIILAVQFVVVAKGTERVAEVAARFTLDAMPGRQMSIDADMRAGLIPQAEARSLRLALQRESQLYGALDGAMKFVKNDAVATIIIALVNIVAGLATGILVKKLDFLQASQKYTILTIGDGLAAIIPSVLVSISAGIVITRVASESEASNVGSDIVQQILRDAKPITITAVLFLALLLIPGMPHIPLLLFGSLLGLLAYSIRYAQKRKANAAAQLEGQSERPLEHTYAVPISVGLSKELSVHLGANSAGGAHLRQQLPKLRSAIYYDLGVLLPVVHISLDLPLTAGEYFIAIKEVPLAKSTLKPDAILANAAVERLRGLGIEGEATFNPATLRPCTWISPADREKAGRAGVKTWDLAEVLLLHLSHLMRRHAHEFVGIQEAQALLDFAARGLPKLVESVVPGRLTIHQFTDVLQRLVQEEISIRDIKSLLDALAEWAGIEQDPVMLTEHVRSSLKRYISFKYSKGRNVLFVYLLDPEIEDVIRSAVRRTATGSFLSLEASISNDILQALLRTVRPALALGKTAVIITDAEIRRFVRKIVEVESPEIPVVSYQELTPELRVQPLGTVSMRPNQAPAVNPEQHQPARAKVATQGL